MTEGNIIGSYQQKEKISAKLILKKDKTFEFAGPEITLISKSYSATTNQYILTTGTWQVSGKKLILNSFITDSLENENRVTDSIASFTSITSFNFWNRYGDPVSIRSILLPSSKTKPHFGNNLYFFAQDFKTTDTLKFHFDGYPDFTYPGTIPYAIGNNIHKIILREPYRPAVFFNTILTIKKNILVETGNRLVFDKKK